MKKILPIFFALLLFAGCAQKEIDSQNKRLDAIEADLVAKNKSEIFAISQRIDKISNYLDEYIESMENERIPALEDNIKALKLSKKDLNDATENLTKLIEDLDKGTKDWATAKFETIEQYNTTSARLTDISKKMGELSETIDNLQIKLYKDILDLYSTCDTEIKDVLNDIKTIRESLEKSQTTADALKRRIQSIVVVPDYSDGSVAVGEELNTMYFVVTPKEIADSIAKLSDLTRYQLRIMPVQTKVFSAVPDNIKLESVKMDGDYLAVSFGGDALPSDLIAKTQEYCGQFSITYDQDTVSVASATFPLYFKTLPPAELDAVQLWEGGPLWANVNVGAARPQDPGYFFIPGSTEVIFDGFTADGFNFLPAYPSGFDKPSDPYYNGSTWTKYLAEAKILEDMDDAAYVHMGSGWRTPGGIDWRKLVANCSWTWCDGVNVKYNFTDAKGFIVRGKGAYADRQIFLPFCGYGNLLQWKKDVTIYMDDTVGYFSTDKMSGFMMMEDVNLCDIKEYPRGVYGMPVRAIKD